MIQAMRFVWDAGKAEANFRRHGVTFEEASELLRGGEDVVEIYDEAHSSDEDRFIAIGMAQRGVLCVVFTEREEDVRRIISARRATQAEQRLYERRVHGELS